MERIVCEGCLSPYVGTKKERFREVCAEAEWPNLSANERTPLLSPHNLHREFNMDSDETEHDIEAPDQIYGSVSVLGAISKNMLVTNSPKKTELATMVENDIEPAYRAESAAMLALEHQTDSFEITVTETMDEGGRPMEMPGENVVAKTVPVAVSDITFESNSDTSGIEEAEVTQTKDKGQVGEPTVANPMETTDEDLVARAMPLPNFTFQAVHSSEVEEAEQGHSGQTPKSETTNPIAIETESSAFGDRIASDIEGTIGGGVDLVKGAAARVFKRYKVNPEDKAAGRKFRALINPNKWVHCNFESIRDVTEEVHEVIKRFRPIWDGRGALGVSGGKSDVYFYDRQALKMTKLDVPVTLDQVKNEIAMQALAHLSLPAIVPKPSDWVAKFEGKFFFMMKKAPPFAKSVHKLIQDEQRSRFDRAIELLEDAVRTLADSGICHRDLHAENVLYDFRSDSIRIIDFGEAVQTTAFHCDEEAMKYFQELTFDAYNANELPLLLTKLRELQE